MSRRYLWALVLGLAAACNDGGTGPTQESVSVSFPSGGTIFIGDNVQFQAQLMSSDGTRDVTNEATWGSDAPNVATVSPSGLVTAVAAGEASIFADVNPRGSMRIRVFPSFGGSWAGNEVIQSCEASGVFEGFCREPEFAPGEVFAHNSSFTQNGASVDAVIVTGPDTSAMMTGTITVGGLLELPGAPSLPADPRINSEIRNWRSRADTPSRMTGTYEGFLTAPGADGSITLGIRLENVVKTTATSTRSSSTAIQTTVRRLSTHLQPLR